MGLLDALKKKPKPALAPPVDPPPSLPIALRNYLDVIAIQHAPFARVRSTFELADGGLRVVVDDVVTAAGPAPPKHLAFDPALVKVLQSAAATELARVAGMFTTVTVEHGAAGYDVVMSGDDAERRYGPVPLDVVLFSPAQLAELSVRAAAIDAGIAALRSVVGAHVNKTWDRQADPHRLSFRFDGDRQMTLECAIVGSLSTAELTWCWAHHNAGFAPEIVVEMKRLRDGLAPAEAPTCLGRPGFRADGGIAWTAAHLAALRLGRDAVFCWPLPNKPVQLFFAVTLPPAVAPRAR